MSTPSKSLNADVLSTSFQADPAKKPETAGNDAGTGKKIITPLEARKLQSAESLKPLHERDVGPGSYVALTQRAAARNVKAGLVDAFVRSRSVAKPSTGTGTEPGSGSKDEVGSGSETGKKSQTAMTDETTTTAVDRAAIDHDAKDTTAKPPIQSSPLPLAQPTSPLERPVARKPTDPTSVAPTAQNTNTNINAGPASSKKPLHRPSLSHHDSPPPKNTSARVSSAGSAGVGGKKAGSNPLQESDGNKRVVSSGAGDGSESSTGRGGGGKSGEQDGKVAGEGTGKRTSDGAGKGKGKK